MNSGILAVAICPSRGRQRQQSLRCYRTSSRVNRQQRAADGQAPAIRGGAAKTLSNSRACRLGLWCKSASAGAMCWAYIASFSRFARLAAAVRTQRGCLRPGGKEHMGGKWKREMQPPWGRAVDGQRPATGSMAQPKGRATSSTLVGGAKGLRVWGRHYGRTTGASMPGGGLE